MSVDLSLVQLGPIGDIGVRAAAAERAGYQRFWFTQHYGYERSGSPLVAAALAAAATETLRVGTAAVLLAHATPVQVAADAALLTQQSAGRFDLGVASAVVDPPQLATALGQSVCSFEHSTAELAALVRGDHDLSPWAGPTTASPPLWICGSSARSGALAARLGAGLAHGPVDERSPAIIADYRSQFVSTSGSQPKVSILARGYCAGTAAEAERMWRDLGAVGVGFTADFLGDPEQCAAAVTVLGAVFGADEIAVTHVGPSAETIDRSALLLAKAWRSDD